MGIAKLPSRGSGFGLVMWMTIADSRGATLSIGWRRRYDLCPHLPAAEHRATLEPIRHEEGYSSEVFP